MNRSIAATAFVAALGLSLAAPASAQPVCSLATVAGQWASTMTGTVVTPAGAVPAAGVAKTVIDREGNVSGTQTATTNGAVSQNTIKGTIAVNPDCTGTETLNVYDQSGALVRTVVEAIVVDGWRHEMRAIVTSIALPNGTTLPAVLTYAKAKLFPAWPF